LPSAFSELLIEIDSKLTPQPDKVSFPDSFSERLPDLRKHPKPQIVSSAQSESQKKAVSGELLIRPEDRLDGAN